MLPFTPPPRAVWASLAVPEAKWNIRGSSGRGVLPRKLPALVKEFLAGELKQALFCHVPWDPVTRHLVFLTFLEDPTVQIWRSQALELEVTRGETLGSCLPCLCSVSSLTRELYQWGWYNYLPLETTVTIWRSCSWTSPTGSRVVSKHKAFWYVPSASKRSLGLCCLHSSRRSGSAEFVSLLLMHMLNRVCSVSILTPRHGFEIGPRCHM